MGDFLSPSILSTPPPPPPPPLPSTKSNLPMLYYGLVVVGTAVIVLTVYNIIVIKWCTQRPPRRTNRFVEVTNASQSFENPSRNLLSSFKYKKDVVAQEQGSEFECAVCLSVFEDGDEVRQLPRCKHSFHVSCIDMWLYSHSDCPLCRALATPRLDHHHQPLSTTENSREGLLGSGVNV